MKLFQFWDRPDPPPDVAAAMAQWSAVEGFEYMRMDEAAGRQLLASFGERYAAAFDRCAYPEMKSDLFRYAAIQRFGGIYIDADLAPKEGAVEILRSVESGGLMRAQSTGDANTDLLVFPEAGHGVLVRLLDLAVDRITSGAIKNLYLVTGPGLVKWEIQRLHPELMSDIRIVPCDAFLAAFEFPRVAYKGPGKHWSHRMKAGVPIYADQDGLADRG